jgi:hypothetical protein
MKDSSFVISVGFNQLAAFVNISCGRLEVNPDWVNPHLHPQELFGVFGVSRFSHHHLLRGDGKGKT